MPRSEGHVRHKFKLRLHDAELGWESNHWTYYRFALDLLPMLAQQNEEVRRAWPVPFDKPVENSQANYPELSVALDERHRTSDSIRVYAAMAVEGFLNWYGVLRLGADVFNSQFERLGLVPKLQALLLVCDAVVLEKNDPLVQALERVAATRNALVHPKAKEFDPADPLAPPKGNFCDAANGAAENMQLFFEAFVEAVPEAEHLVPRG